MEREGHGLTSAHGAKRKKDAPFKLEIFQIGYNHIVSRCRPEKKAGVPRTPQDALVHADMQSERRATYIHALVVLVRGNDWPLFVKRCVLVLESRKVLFPLY